ncbi:hypothetical protein RRG08_053954 [Elysia crispata]|uniref:Uncharacterized protein n=1 Tax=Elysia crispata TaxID=231223 RepID=A0AAE0ZF66_9GAST|nr:hypothetical protein RRG08_053954 [Elysia crispata]
MEISLPRKLATIAGSESQCRQRAPRTCYKFLAFYPSAQDLHTHPSVSKRKPYLPDKTISNKELRTRDNDLKAQLIELQSSRSDPGELCHHGHWGNLPHVLAWTLAGSLAPTKSPLALVMARSRKVVQNQYSTQLFSQMLSKPRRTDLFSFVECVFFLTTMPAIHSIQRTAHCRLRNLDVQIVKPDERFKLPKSLVKLKCTPREPSCPIVTLEISTHAHITEQELRMWNSTADYLCLRPEDCDLWNSAVSVWTHP